MAVGNVAIIVFAIFVAAVAMQKNSKLGLVLAAGFLLVGVFI